MNDNRDSARELLTLRDEAACRRVLSLYGSSQDWRDPDGLSRLVWPDALIDYGFFLGTGTEFVRAFIDIAHATIRPFHLMVCERLVVNGRLADAESVGISITFETGPGGSPVARQFWGRYLDQLEKRGEEWRIRSRKYLLHGAFDVSAMTGASVQFPGIHEADNLSPGHPWFRNSRF